MPVNRQPTEAEQLARTAHAKRLGPASQTIESLDIPKQLKIQEPVVLDLRNEIVRRSMQYAEKGVWEAAMKTPCLETLPRHPRPPSQLLSLSASPLAARCYSFAATCCTACSTHRLHH